jgi:uncharacterized membrane protein SpoIIM required for sporulation
MDIERWIAHRRQDWKRLESLLDAADDSPAWELGHERIQEIVRLYRLACSDLNRARAATANAELLDRLNRLTGRGYRFVYRGGRRRSHFRETAHRFLAEEAPGAFRREGAFVLAASAAFLLGSLLGFAAVLVNPANGQTLIPDMFFTESPRDRVERIEREGERIENVGQAAAFGAFLYTHNIQVAFLAFSLGALTIAGGLWILFHNGVLLGAVAAMYLLDGVHVFFVAWVGPHGALEIPAILFAGAAGLKVGSALWMPGDLTRASALRNAFPSVWRIMVTSALVLVAAGLIEGSFSQFSAKSIPYGLKIGAAVVLFALLLAYLFLMPAGRRKGAA